MAQLIKKSTTKKRRAIKPARVSAPVREKSAWCTYLNENASAEATVLRAPTVSGEINDEGRKGATLGFDIMNIAKAKLIEDTAEAKCRRYIANAALNRMVVIAPNKLSRAGYVAKARVINSRSSYLRAVRTQVKRELAIGNLDRSQATKLLIAADNVLTEGAKARSEASKRQGLVAYDLDNLNQMSSQLLKAEKDLADINSNIRSADAVSVNLEGGWRDGQINNGLKVQDESYYGGVKVSVKLGAFNPMRYSHERAATRARLRAHRAEPGSVFWKLSELKNAQSRGRAGIVAARRTLIAGRANAGRLRQNLPSDDPAYAVQRIATEIQIIKLDAEIAATTATLRQIDKNLRKLSRMGN